MIPSIPVPTDNIYKFTCLFGLTLIVSAFFGFIACYNAALDAKLKHYELVVQLEAKDAKTKAETDLIDLHKKVIDVTKSNEQIVTGCCTAVLIFGVVLSIYGARNWRLKIQERDDRMAQVQISKIEKEVEKLSLEITKLQNEGTIIPISNVPEGTPLAAPVSGGPKASAGSLPNSLDD